MSQWPSPAVAGDAAGHPQAALTPEAIEGVLADFRSWLHQLAGAALRSAAAVCVVSSISVKLAVRLLYSWLVAKATGFGNTPG